MNLAVGSLTFDLNCDCITPSELCRFLRDTSGGKHHTAVLARVPHGGAVDAERGLHVFDTEGLRAHDGVVSHQVRADVLALCLHHLQCVGIKGALELDNVPFSYSGRPHQ